METKLLKGKPVSSHIKSRLSKKISNLKEDGVIPGLAAVLVGDDPASHVYVRSKSKVLSQIIVLVRHIKCQRIHLKLKF